MVTDWLHNPRAVMLVPLLVATGCALLLAVTRVRFPPEQARWRLIRALIIIGFWFAGLAIITATLGKSAAMLLMPPSGAEAATWLSLAAYLAGTSLLLGWLIPWGIEGRSLREMGWRRHRAIRYFLVAALATLLVASLMPIRGMPAEMAEMLGISDARASAILLMPDALAWVLLMGFVLGAWTQENLFRGHLLPAFREVGMSGGGANMAQAAVFVVIHIPGLIIPLGDQRVEHGIAAMVVAALVAAVAYLIVGLFLGWLRMRFDSIVPGFAVHGTWNAMMVARAWAGMFIVIQRLQ